MTEPTPDPEPLADAVPPPPAARRRWWHRWKLILVIILLTPVLLATLFTVATLTWTYSNGQRAGYLQKFSRKGWVCKTWEGELAITTVPGVAPTTWEFTVRDDAAARQLNLGLGRRVILFYREHRGFPRAASARPTISWTAPGS